MRTSPIQLTDVIYNSSNQCFEGLVTVHHNQHSVRYACAIEAPITMSFEDAAQGLSKQALRRHKARGGLRSQMGNHAPRTRAGRAKIDPVKWLSDLINRPDAKVA